MRVLVANGPNLDRLGTREPEIYGSTTLAELNAMVADWGQDLGVETSTYQSNSEAELIGQLTGREWDGVVLNPAALTHTSRALADAIASMSAPVVEVHISNVRSREPWRRVSYIAPVAVRTIYGRGVDGYRAALRHLVNRAATPFETYSYGPHPAQVADLRGTDPSVVLIHGGVWLPQFERDLMETLAVALSARGVDSVNLEYRRLGEGGGWPGSAHDVKMALDHLALGGKANPVTLLTHSAGSYLGAWAAERSRLTVAAHVALAPLLDLSASVDSRDPCSPQAKAMIDMGAPPVLLPQSTPTYVIHGIDDDLVPIEHTRDLASRHGLSVDEVEGGHMSLLHPHGDWWDRHSETLGASS